MPFQRRSRATRALARALQPSRPRRGTRVPRIQCLEDRVVPSILLEVESNDTQATAQLAPVPTGDILTTAPADWLEIQGSVANGTDVDYYQFTLASASGVFFDVDSREIGLSTTLNSIVTLFNSSSTQIATNNDGYDFEGFAAPIISTFNAASPDSSLYADLAAGTYAIRVTSSGSTSGDYHLRILADPNYTTSVPVFHSNSGAADTLYLDFDGHSATDAWGTYTAAPYDFNNQPNQFSPAERLAIFNAWRVTAEDYSPFQIDVTTATPGTIANGVGQRQVITNSDSTIVGQPSGILGIAFVGSYAGFNDNDNTSFTFAGNFGSYAGGIPGNSPQIMAIPLEIGNTTSHEFGHALGLAHYNSQTGGTGSIIPSAIMATPDIGLNRETWATGTNTDGKAQDDMAVISGAANTFGYRPDDHGGTRPTATVLTPTGNVYTATGRIEQVTDLDYFKFSGSGATTIQLDVFDYVNDLDTELRLFDSSGTLLATSAPTNSFDASISQSLGIGTYYLEVRGTGAAGVAGEYSLRIDTVVKVPPTLSGIETTALGYIENQTLPVTSTLTVTDPDNTDLTGATVSITTNFVSGQDELLFTNQNGITGSYSAGVLTLTGTATLAQYQAALRSVQYRNNSENPSTSTRTVSWRVTDPDGNASNIVTRNITVTAVNDPPVAANDAYTTDEDVPLTVVAPGVLGNDTDPDNPTLTAIKVTDPTHGTLTLNANGSFTYTPAANYHGPDSFTYKANDGQADSNIATVSITVNSVNDPPVAVNDSYTVPEDNTLTVLAPGVLTNDSDVDGDPITAVLVTSVSHGALSLSADGSFVYTPAANFNGTDSFTYKANDGQALSAAATVTITVTAVNDPPVAVNDAYATDEDTTLNVAAPGVLGNDTDVDNDPLTAVLVSGPQHGALTLNSNGSFTYTPAANYHGPDSFTYKANDGKVDSNVATVSITVNSVNDPPVAVNDAYTVLEDNTLTVSAPGVLTNDSDVDGDPITAVLVGSVSHGTLTLSADGSFVYKPVANFNGTDSFTYKASDGQALSAVATVTITVTPVNDVPVAANDAYTTDEDTTLNVAAPGVLGNDTDVDGDPLTAVLVSVPQHGTLSLNSNGSLTYTPAANYHGPDSFTYKANDGTVDSNLATVSITVNSVNDVPVAVPESYTVLEDNTLTVPAAGVLANDSDADGDPLTAVKVTDPAHGTLALNPDGSFTYTPVANFNGADSFTYKASDGQATSPATTVTINVTAVNDAPVANDDAYSTPEDQLLTVPAPGVLGNDVDVDSPTLTAALVTTPQHGALTFNANGSFTYMPAANYHGADSFTYKVSDGLVDSGIATVNLTVISVNDAPVAIGESFGLDEDTPLTVAAPGLKQNDSDIDGDPLTPIKVSDPAHGTVTINTDGSFAYTPFANYNGPDAFTYKENDGTADSNVVTVALTIRPVNDAPVAVDDTTSVLQHKSVAIKVLTNDSDVDGDLLTLTGFTQPSSGTVSRSGNTFTYTPFPLAVGPDTFTYSIADGHGGTATGTVHVTVLDIVAPTIRAIRVHYGSSPRAFVDLRSVGRSVLPWANVTRFDVVFSENVQVDASDLTLTGVVGGAYPLNFSYNPATRTASWTLAAPLPADRLTLRLLGTGPNGVRDLGGNLLGSDWARAFGVLPGDFDGNGLVDDRDLSQIRAAFNTNPALVNRWADISGDGIVNMVDYNLAKANRGRRLP